MVWSERRGTVEQGCSAVWLLCRELPSRAVIVDRAVATETDRVASLFSRLISLASATSMLSLRSWALCALWSLVDDARFRHHYARRMLTELQPLLVRLVLTYGPMHQADQGLSSISKLTSGMPDEEELAASTWDTDDLRAHCERQRLCAIALGTLLHLTFYEDFCRRSLQDDAKVRISVRFDD